MRVIHILKDGSAVEDIVGHVVRIEDAGALYNLIHAINSKSGTMKTREKSGRKVGSDT